jgi:hypothetical protein
MPFHIHCPNGHLLEIEDSSLGRKVLCPHCQAVMRPQAAPSTNVITAAPAPPPMAQRAAEAVEMVEVVEGPPPARRVAEADLPPRRPRRHEDDYDDYDEPRYKSGGMKKATRMRLANVGLALHAGKILCYLIGILCVLIAFGLAVIDVSTTRSRGVSIAAVVLLGIFMLLWVLAPLLGVVGSMLCMWVPHKTGAKMLIIVSFLLDALGLLIYVGCQVASFLTGALAFNTLASSGPTADALGVLAIGGILASALMMFVGWILFMLFLRNMLFYFNESGFAHDCMQTMILCILLSVMTPFLFGCAVVMLIRVALAIHPALAGLGMVLFILLWIVFWVKLLINILNQIVVVRGHLSRWA